MNDRYVRVAGQLMPIGALACTEVQHLPVYDQHIGTICIVCFGWRDDPRHCNKEVMRDGRTARTV